MHDGHVAHRGHEHQRVHCDVGGHVDEVVHQFAGDSAELPTFRAVLVRGERWDDDDEAEISECEIQQQKIGDGAHLTLRQDDVDDERVASDASDRDDAEQRRNDHSEQHEVEPLIGDRTIEVIVVIHCTGDEAAVHHEATDPLIHETAYECVFSGECWTVNSQRRNLDLTIAIASNTVTGGQAVQPQPLSHHIEPCVQALHVGVHTRLAAAAAAAEQSSTSVTAQATCSSAELTRRQCILPRAMILLALLGCLHHLCWQIVARSHK